MQEKNKSYLQIYQNKDGDYLPDINQPNPSNSYLIIPGIYSHHDSTRYMNVYIGHNGKPMFRNKTGMLVESDKDLPSLYNVREECCGCTACNASCRSRAIYMRPDEEGFLYPVVDAEKCIRCYKCIEVCPSLK